MKKFFFFLLLAGAGTWYYFYLYKPQHEGDAGQAAASEGAAKEGGGSGKSGSGKSKRDSGPVPVVTGLVKKKDVPVFLNGLGNVQAFNTVTVRTRVDGQIDKVAFIEGQDVKAGDLLIQIDPRPYQAVFDQTSAKRATDEAQLTNARVDLKRYKELLEKNATPEKTYTTQKALVDQLEATVKADEANIEAAQVNLNYTRITSPLDGRVGIRLVDQGNIVHAADTSGLVVITQLKPISVIFTLPEQNLPSIQEQMGKGQLKCLALGRDDKALSSEGALAVVDNEIDVTTGTIKLKGTFPNENLALWPGQYVNVRLQLSVRGGSLVVPAQVVQRGPEGTYAFIVKADDTVESRPLTVAFFESGNAVIEKGLEEGEKVVVDGQYRLQIGSKIVDRGAADQPQKGSDHKADKGDPSPRISEEDAGKTGPGAKGGPEHRSHRAKETEDGKKRSQGETSNPVS